MEKIYDFGNYAISENDVLDIVNQIIEILANKNITHAGAYMILERTKEELANTVIKKFV